MLKEAIEAIAKLVRDGSKPEVVKHAFGQHADLVLLPTGEHIEARHPLPTTGVTAETLDSFVLLLQEANVSLVYVGRESVCFFEDEEYREGCVKYTPFVSAAALWVKDMPFEITQRELIDAIKQKMWGTGLEAILPDIRQMEWNRKSDGRSTIEHGRESLGKDVELSVQKADRIPERITLSIPWYLDFRHVYGIHVSIELNPHSERFRLSVVDDEYSRMVDLARYDLLTEVTTAVSGLEKAPTVVLATPE